MCCPRNRGVWRPRVAGALLCFGLTGGLCQGEQVVRGGRVVQGMRVLREGWRFGVGGCSDAALRPGSPLRRPALMFTGRPLQRPAPMFRSGVPLRRSPAFVAVPP